MKKQIRYLVYENWQQEKKAVIHTTQCSKLKSGLTRIGLPKGPNCQWHGLFKTIKLAVDFANSLNDRELKFCKSCLRMH